jgi:hypothetical protein
MRTKIYRTIILAVFLYGCETGSLTLREEDRLQMFGKGAEENNWTKERRNNMRLGKLHNEELHNLYPLPNMIGMTKARRMRRAEHVACMGEEYIRGFGGKT